MEPMFAPKTLSQYPWVVVRIECKLCPRKGAYRLARLAARYGPEFPLEGLIEDLAHNCPYWRNNPRKYDPRCGARFVDLERNLPPPDDPDAPLYRQRQPGREDLPQRRSLDHLRYAGSTPTLAGWAADLMTVICPRCVLRETWIKAELLAIHGDARLTDLLIALTSTCAGRKATSMYEQCGARYEMP